MKAILSFYLLQLNHSTYFVNFVLEVEILFEHTMTSYILQDPDIRTVNVKKNTKINKHYKKSE